MYNLNKVFDEFFNQEVVRSFPLDVVETKEGYKVIAELAGVTKENLNISYENDYLVIEALKKLDDNQYLINERSSGKYKRYLFFKEIDEDGITAKLENGLLIIDLKRKESLKKRIVIA